MSDPNPLWSTIVDWLGMQGPVTLSLYSCGLVTLVFMASKALAG
ncbi:hypothetical protein FHS96_002813 [Sphingomonas zeicaulis]